MNKTIKIIFIALGLAVLSGLPSLARAGGLSVQFEKTPLFSEANFLPGQNITRFVKITNTSGSQKPIAIEAINENDGGLASQLDITIKEGMTTLYSKTIAQFFSDGEIFLSNLANNATVQYDLTIDFNASSGDNYQGKTVSFDILIGFQGQEGVSDGAGGALGGGLPAGLSIFNETTILVQDTSVTIFWQTNYPSTSQVIYSAQGQPRALDLSLPHYGYANAAPDPEDSDKVAHHSVTITGLIPGTTYYYRCVSHASPLTISAERTFTTGTSKTATPPGEVMGERTRVEIQTDPAKEDAISSPIAQTDEKTQSPPKKDEKFAPLAKKTFGFLAGAGLSDIFQNIASSKINTSFILLLLAILALIFVKNLYVFFKKKKEKNFSDKNSN